MTTAATMRATSHAVLMLWIAVQAVGVAGELGDDTDKYEHHETDADDQPERPAPKTLRFFRLNCRRSRIIRHGLSTRIGSGVWSAGP